MADKESQYSRLGKDLRRRREMRGPTLEELAQATKIPIDTLEYFESGRLFENPAFNAVYMRSLAGAYAEHVGVSLSLLLKAIDEVRSGQYDGSRLTGAYTPPDSPEEPEDDSEEPSDEDEPTIDEEPEPESDDVDQHTEERPKRSMRLRSFSSIVLLGLAVALVIWRNRVGVEEPVEPPIESPEESEVLTPVEPVLVVQPATRLGSPLYATIVAIEVLEPIRVHVDDDLRRPYWIEQGSVWAFEFDDQLEIEEEIEHITLFVDQFAIALDTVQSGASVKLSRTVLTERLEAGLLAPADVPVASDTIRAF